MPDFPQDVSDGETGVSQPTQPTGTKRKERSPPTASSRKKPHGEEAEAEEVVDTDSGAEESSEGEGDYKGKYKRIKYLINDLIRWGNSQYKSKKVNNIQLTEIRNKLAMVTELVSSVELDTHFMAGRLSERVNIEKAIGQNVTESQGGPKTFAEMARLPKVPKVTGVAKVTAPKVIFVKSQNDDLDLNEVKDVIKRSVRPGKIGVNIRRVVKTARGVMVETENVEQLEKFKECRELADKGLVFEKPKKRSPRLMVYDVEPAEDAVAMIEDIYDQNMADQDIDLETFKREFKIVHEYKRKDPGDSRLALVVECTARVRNVIRRNDRIYVGWQSCRIKDYNPLVRCYKCQSFGHVAKYCKNKVVCPHCAEGHEGKECKNKNRPARCANCLSAKKDSGHAIGHPRCPEYVRATKIAHEKIDYGQ